MKSSIHLLYGIIIGILLVACTGQTTSETTSSTGSIKQDKAEFEVEEIVYAGKIGHTCNKIKEKYRKEGWTIIDWEVCGNGISGDHFFHVGK
jgi:hypothetical protein